jgi:hypothetical protein
MAHERQGRNPLPFFITMNYCIFAFLVYNIFMSNLPPSLWIEKGFSRREIASRMLAAVPHLNIYSTPGQPIPNTRTIEYPSLKEEDGIAQINELINEHGIDAIWPQNSAKYDLSGIKAQVHAAAVPEVIALVDDKAKFTEWLGENDPMQAYSTAVLGVEGIAKEYEKRRAEGRDVCVKPIVGVFGQGYWHLTEEPQSSLLNNPSKREIHPDIYLNALAIEENTKEPQRTLVMDYLPGPEVSVDLLQWHGKPVIHAARTKLSSSEQRILLLGALDCMEL